MNYPEPPRSLLKDQSHIVLLWLRTLYEPATEGTRRGGGCWDCGKVHHLVALRVEGLGLRVQVGYLRVR